LSAGPFALAPRGGGFSVALWFQFSCVGLGVGSADFVTYAPCAATGSGSAALLSAPSWTLAWTPGADSAKSGAFKLSVSVVNTSFVSLPFAGNPLSTVAVALAWGGCSASALFPTSAYALLSQYAHGLAVLSVGAFGGASLAVNNVFLDLATNGHPSCYEGYPWFSSQTGVLSLTKTNAAFGLPSGTLYADVFGFDDLQVYSPALGPANAAALFDSVYNTSAYQFSLPSPPPAGALGTAADAFSACASAPPAHRYLPGSSQYPGMLSDGAGGWHARRADGGASALPGAPGGLTGGTLLFPVPAGALSGAPANDLAGAAGLTVRLLFDGAVVPAFDWAGFSAATLASGATLVSNSYTGAAASFVGPGTAAHPAAPAIAGQYTTFVLGPGGASVYAGPYLWGSFPTVFFAAGSQGANTALNRVTLGASATLQDLQVYNYAMSPAQVVGIAQGGGGC
jgi:hypothetical protein